MYDYDKYQMTNLCRDALKLYFTRGIAPGGFLTAVLTNDLFGAVSRADRWNITLIPEYVRFLVNETPGISWGSTEKMQRWMENF